MTSISAFLYFLLLCNVLPRSGGLSAKIGTYSEILRKAIDSISKAVKFYSITSAEVTIDSQIGLAILRDTLSGICDLQTLPPSLSVRVCEVSGTVKGYHESRSRPNASSDLEFLAKFNWKAFIAYGDTTYVQYSSTELPAQLLQQCLRELSDRYRNDCLISKVCEREFFGGMVMDFHLPHQIFYYEALMRSQCRTRNQQHYDIIRLAETLCHSAFTNLESLLAKRNSSVTARQTLLKEVTYCGLSGHFLMAHPKLLEEIVAWQDVSGCFTASLGVKEATDKSPAGDACQLDATVLAANALAMHIYRFATQTTIDPDFYSVLAMETVLLENEKKFPGFVDTRRTTASAANPSKWENGPYANAPDSVLW